MINPLKTALVAVGCLAMLPTVTLANSRSASALSVQQLSYATRCAEEDNVILKINPAGKDVQGVNILPEKPVFSQRNYAVATAPDFTGCHWVSRAAQVSPDYYPSCPGGYMDRNQVCRPAAVETLFADARWVIKAERSTHWQPFMKVVDAHQRALGEYKSLTVSRADQLGAKGAASEIAVIYSDGYLRPVYFARAGEPSGWGGSFILGDARFTLHTTPRYHSNIRQVRVVGATNEQLTLELRFANHPDDGARLVLYYDYNRRGIDWFPPANRGPLLSFVSMYREATSFDIEFLAGGQRDGRREYHIMDPLIDGSVFTSGVWLGKRHPSKHNTLAPDFQITAR